MHIFHRYQLETETATDCCTVCVYKCSRENCNKTKTVETFNHRVRDWRCDQDLDANITPLSPSLHYIGTCQKCNCEVERWS